MVQLKDDFTGPIHNLLNGCIIKNNKLSIRNYYYYVIMTLFT